MCMCTCKKVASEIYLIIKKTVLILSLVNLNSCYCLAVKPVFENEG